MLHMAVTVILEVKNEKGRFLWGVMENVNTDKQFGILKDSKNLQENSYQFLHSHGSCNFSTYQGTKVLFLTLEWYCQYGHFLCDLHPTISLQGNNNNKILHHLHIKIPFCPVCLRFSHIPIALFPPWSHHQQHKPMEHDKPYCKSRELHLKKLFFFVPESILLTSYSCVEHLNTWCHSNSLQCAIFFPQGYLNCSTSCGH